MMYYEEKMINGVLHCRNSPNDEWRRVSIETLSSRAEKLKEVQSQLTASRKQNAELVRALENLTDLVAEIELTLFHHNHAIVGWHQNGDPEPIMNFVADFDMEAQKQALLLSIRIQKEES